MTSPSTLTTVSALLMLVPKPYNHILACILFCDIPIGSKRAATITSCTSGRFQSGIWIFLGGHKLNTPLRKWTTWGSSPIFMLWTGGRIFHSIDLYTQIVLYCNPLSNRYWKNRKTCSKDALEGCFLTSSHQQQIVLHTPWLCLVSRRPGPFV